MEAAAGGHPSGWLRAGRVGRPHGLDGSFHVVLANPALLDAVERVTVGGREREIVRRAGTASRPIIRLDDCDDRDAAQALRGEELTVPRSVAPALEEDEWWAEDLVGCLAARPMPPVMAAARSVRMSPKRLSVTTTSNRAGSVTRWIVAASTCW